MTYGLSYLRRCLWPWGLILIFSVGACVAVFRLYGAARREVAEQQERAIAAEAQRLQSLVRQQSEALKHSTLAALASRHVDGLRQSLRRWDAGSESVIGTFVWSGEAGLGSDAVVPPGMPEAAGLGDLWVEFRQWRAAHPEGVERSLYSCGSFQCRAWRMQDNPRFPPSETGYQGENLDWLARKGHGTDAWAGWAAPAGGRGAPWVFWYQLGPDSPVRGCFVDAGALAAGLSREFGDTPLVRTLLAPDDGAGVTAFGEDLPGYAARIGPGSLFLDKQADLRLTLVLTMLLLAGFLAGLALLVSRTRREFRDAERKISFVGQVSHELRTPLTSIRMFADMLGEPGLPEEKRVRYAERISRESLRLGGLIERLLTFNALEKGDRRPELAKFDCSQVIRETLDELQPRLKEAGLAVDTKLPGESVVAFGEASAFKQALINLVDNALKYAASAGVLELEAFKDAGFVQVRVRDRGPGVPVEIRSRVFEPFVQGGRTLTNKSPGVGLGLSIARGLLRQGGGDLLLLPTEVGACFQIQIPLSKD